MEEQAAGMESLYEKAKDYVNTNLELAKLKAIDKTSEVVSTLVPRLIVALLLLIFLFIVNIAIALWLGDLLGKSWYGFLAVSGFYLFVALIVHFFVTPSLKKSIANAVVSRLLD